MKKLLLLLTVISFIGIGSCKKDKDPDICTTNWAVQISDELESALTKYMTFLSDPSTANCNAYKTSMQAYLNALRQFEGCSEWSAVDRQDLAESIDEAEEELATACEDLR